MEQKDFSQLISSVKEAGVMKREIAYTVDQKRFLEIAKEFVALEKKHEIDGVFDPCDLASELLLCAPGQADGCGICPLYKEGGCDLSLIGIEEVAMLPCKDTL